MVQEFTILVSYRQIAVFDPQLQQPFNDWTPEHVRQGFAWRSGSVSFATLSEDGMLDVVTEVGSVTRSVGAQRAIRVPFVVGPSGQVEVASISDGRRLDVPSGEYGLYYQTGWREGGRMWCRLTFAPGHFDDAEVVIADSDLAPPAPLLMRARPA